MWEQRFYTDGRLAPCWGYQVDETASVVYGIYDHYTRMKDIKFLNENLKMVEKAVKYLEKYVDDMVFGEHKEHVSYDLWENYEGVSIYSLACVYAAFDSMIKIYEELEKDGLSNRLKKENVIKYKEKLRERQKDIKRFIVDKFYDEEKKSFVRNEKERTLDISTLGLVVPFNIFSPKEKKITNTIERINMNLRTYTGGYLRFEQDYYTHGRPWVIATLWMALYYLEIDDQKQAKECFDFVVNSANMHGFLAEQVENSTMTPAWVIGLGWSHAMFIIVLEEFAKRGII